MTGLELYEFLGKPDAEYLEARVRQTQEELKKPRDNAHKVRLEAQAEMYLQAMLYLEEQDVIKEASTFANRAAKEIALLKSTLKGGEVIEITRERTDYKYLASDGTPLEMSGVSSLAIVKELQLTPELVEGLANRERGVATKVRKMAKAVAERRKRLEGIQGAVAVVAHALMDGVQLIVRENEALLTTSAKALKDEYKTRLKLIKTGKWTEQHADGRCSVDGKEYAMFRAVK